MANFKAAFNRTVKAEGGYVNDKDDTGGETYLGISRNNHPKSEMWAIIDKVKKENPGFTNKSLTNILKQNTKLDEIAENIYKTQYWDKMHLDDLNSDKIAKEIFDMGVNAGISRAIKLAQNIVELTPSGKYTSELIKLINEYKRNNS